MILDSGGNFGIGTDSPGSKLHIGGNGSITLDWDSGTSAPGTVVYYSSNYKGGWNFGGADRGMEIYSYSHNTGAFIKFTTKTGGGSATERMRITSGGNVGIGTDDPKTLLDINKNLTSSHTTIPGNTGVTSLPNTTSLFIGDTGDYWGIAMGTIWGSGNGSYIQTTYTSSSSYPLLLQPSGGNVGIWD